MQDTYFKLGLQTPNQVVQCEFRQQRLVDEFFWEQRPDD